MRPRSPKRQTQAPDPGGARWFRHTRHCLKTWAPELEAQFVRLFEAQRRTTVGGSYWAVFADLLAEASHWESRGAGGPERSTIPTRNDERGA